MKQPKIVLLQRQTDNKAANIEYNTLQIAVGRNSGLLSHYSIMETPEQELQKLCIDYSKKKLRGSYYILCHKYDINTDELIETTKHNQVGWFNFDDEYIKEA
jgi:hypothetical protein